MFRHLGANLVGALIISMFFIKPDACASKFVKIAAASDLQFVMQKLVLQFKKENPDINFSENYGSSGNFVSQIESGADFDMFFSADTQYAEVLEKAKLTNGPPKQYAEGILVFCGAEKLQDFTKNEFNKIAIANPEHAPYGGIALESLKSAKIYDQLKVKLVFGENVSQAAQFILSNGAKGGLISKALLYSKQAQNFHCQEVENKLYHPLKQSFVVLKKKLPNDASLKFSKYVLSPAAQEIFRANGFNSVQ